MRHTADITVVIPTYNSGKYISRVLDRLFKESSYVPKQVIIVDGYSKDSTLIKAREYPVEILFEYDRNVATARNNGIKSSNNKIIAFTDSDCVPDKKWIEKIIGRFQKHPTLVGVGGRVLPLEPKNDIEAFSGNVFLNEIMKFPTQIIKPYRKFLPGSFITANCAYRKGALIEIGRFNGFFKNNGEDVDLFWRMIERFPGHLMYDPSIVVYHSFPDSHMGLIKKYFQYGTASSKLARYHLKTPSIDVAIYEKLSKHFVGLVNPSNLQKRTDFLYIIQLISHISGKVYGSFLVKRLNL